MKLDMDQALMDLKGMPMKRDRDSNKPFLLRDACQEALLAPFQDEQSLAPADKVKRFNLAMKLNVVEPDLEVEELNLIKTLVGKAFGALVVGRVYAMIEKTDGKS